MRRMGVFGLVLAAGCVMATVALAAESPTQLRAAMLRAASARHSVHYVSTSSASGHTIRMVSDVGRGRGIQRITFTSHGHSGPATVLVARRTAYIRGNAFTLQSFFGFTKAQAARYASKWISVPSAHPAYSDLTADATFASFLADLLPKKHLKLARATIAGKKAVGVRGTVRQGSVTVVEVVFAPARGTPLPIEAKAAPSGEPGTSLTRMSRWNEPVHVVAPANGVPSSTVGGP
jgi:hypothetical protein